jgi:hypothetical protein
MAQALKYLYVEKHPNICGGRAVIKGTRIPIWLIFRRYRSGQSLRRFKQLIPIFPSRRSMRPWRMPSITLTRCTRI